MVSIDTSKSRAHLALWRLLRPSRGRPDYAPLVGELDQLATERDSAVDERDALRTATSDSAADQIFELRRLLERTSAALERSRQQAEGAESRAKKAEAAGTVANARADRLEELLRLMGVEGFGLKYALNSVCPDRALWPVASHPAERAQLRLALAASRAA
jgi:hypothetical protein